MKRLILSATGGLVLACVAGVGILLVLNRSRSGPNIHMIPVYPGATNVLAKDQNNLRTIHTVNSVPGTAWIGTRGQGASPPASISFAYAYVGHLTFATNDSPQQVYSYYDGVLQTAGWKSLIAAGVQQAPTNPTIGSGIYGPRMYMYDPTPSWLKAITNGYLAIITVHARNSSSGTGSEVFVILDKDEH